MLNYIWLALILLGIGIALATDFADLGEAAPGEMAVEIARASDTLGTRGDCSLRIAREEFRRASGSDPGADLLLNAVFTPDKSGKGGSLAITTDSRSPRVWREAASRGEGKLSARIRLESVDGRGILTLAPVRFGRMRAVANEGILHTARTAVELALGLIGIMALWLGIMKIAEQAGLVAKIAGILRPVTTRLFPDVPGDHPAMGAMIMNIAANMLGLANAATPLGLKAMEELNRLNRKIGTATDAMCTFLVINTSNVQLIPATVIAIRAAAGSANPTEIIGPVIVATTVNTIVGVITVKLLSRLPVFRRQLSETGEGG